MDFETIAIMDAELPRYKVKEARAYQFTDYTTKKIKIIASKDHADSAREKLFPCFDLVNIWDRFYLITSRGKTEITEMEYNDIKRQLNKRYE